MSQAKAPYIYTYSLPLFILFISGTLFITVDNPLLLKFGLNANKLTLHIANIFWLTLSVLTLSMQKKALQNSNPNVFIRAVMGGMLLKMMTGAMAVLVYYMAEPESFNQNMVIVFLMMYVLYLAVEVRMVMKLNKKSHG